MTRSGWRPVLHGMAAAALLCLAACAPPLKDPWGLSVSRGGAPPPLPVPERFQADLDIIPHAPGAPPFSARLYAEPGRRYRLDVFAFPALLAASWLWRDGDWTLVRHDKREVLTGSGTSLEADDMPLRLPDVHAALGFLWAAPLPGFPGTDSPAIDSADGVVRWRHAGETWEARFDPVTGACREVRSPSRTVRYARHRRQGGALVPEEAVISRGVEPLVVLRVRRATVSPSWKQDPFVMRIPEGYRKP